MTWIFHFLWAACLRMTTTICYRMACQDRWWPRIQPSFASKQNTYTSNTNAIKFWTMIWTLWKEHYVDTGTLVIISWCSRRRRCRRVIAYMAIIQMRNPFMCMEHWVLLHGRPHPVCYCDWTSVRTKGVRDRVEMRRNASSKRDSSADVCCWVVVWLVRTRT